MTTTCRTDDPCPVCGTGLTDTHTDTTTRQDCGLCGWSTTWNTTEARIG